VRGLPAIIATFLIFSPQVVKGFVSLCSTMRAGADPVLLCCFLRAMRGLCTHHRTNAEALGQYAVLHIKELSRTSKDDLDLVCFSRNESG
jgi:hypothetical protein